jgi:predicted permease
MLRAKLRSLKNGLFRRRGVESGMADELRFHIESRADALAATGMNRRDAERQARLEFGSTQKYREEIRQARGLRLLDELRGDLRYAARILRNNAAFSLAAVLTLALGIAANSAVFGLVNEVFFRKLPVGHPEELVQFDWLRAPNSMIVGYSGHGRQDPASGLAAMTSFSFATFERIRDQNRTLSDVFAFNPMFGPLNVVADNDAQIAHGQFVSGNYFSALQVPASIGRTIFPNDDHPDAQPVAVISERYWKRRFASSAGVIGKSVVINGASFTIVGVAPPGFFGTDLGDDPDLSIPFATQRRISAKGESSDAWEWWVEMMGRAKPGISRSQILSDIQPLFEQGVRDTFDLRPARYRGGSYNERTVVPPLRVNEGSRGPVTMRRHYAPLLSTLLAVVAVILLIVCANVANLLLARASSRQQEISVRLAIGAGRRRLLRQLLTESMLLAICGGSLGILLAVWGRDFLAWLPDTGEEVLAITPAMDWRVLGFTVGVSLIAGLLFGIFPGLRATAADPSPALRNNTYKGGSSRLLVSKSLLIGQVSMCLVLLMGAGLIVRSVRNLLTAEIGFNARNVVLFTVNPQLNKYDEGRTSRLYEEMSREMQAVPSVQSVTMSGTRPITGGGWSMMVTVNDDPDSRDITSAYVHNIGRHFFETIQIPLLLGRGLTAEEVTGKAKVAVINQAMARRLFKDANPIGKHFRYAEGGMRDHPGFDVVGVVRDARYHKIEGENPPTMYIPFSEGSLRATFEVRTTIDAAAAMAAIRETVARIDRNLPLIEMTTLEDQIRSQIGLYRMFAAFTSIFGVFAVLLACIGLYGIVSYGVTRRINEIGIRMALGANAGDVIRLVMQGTWFVTGIGLLIGLAVALTVTRLIAGWLLYGVTPYDPLTILTALVIIGSVTALAGYLPARRASRVDPMTALRYE